MNFKEYLKEDEDLNEGFLGDMALKYAKKLGYPAFIFLLTWRFDKEQKLVLKAINTYAKSIKKDSEEYNDMIKSFDIIYNSLSDSKLKKTVKTLKNEFESN